MYETLENVKKNLAQETNTFSESEQMALQNVLWRWSYKYSTIQIFQ